MMPVTIEFTLSVTAHEKQLRMLPCAVSRMTPVTLHHCHGGSMNLAGWRVGGGQKQNPFLQIPLHAQYHVGNFGIDSALGAKAWEELFGSQVSMLDWVDSQMAYPKSIWWLAKSWAMRGQVIPVSGLDILT